MMVRLIRICASTSNLFSRIQTSWSPCLVARTPCTIKTSLKMDLSSSTQASSRRCRLYHQTHLSCLSLQPTLLPVFLHRKTSHSCSWVFTTSLMMFHKFQPLGGLLLKLMLDPLSPKLLRTLTFQSKTELTPRIWLRWITRIQWPIQSIQMIMAMVFLLKSFIWD